jgi:hypothetical protein
MSNGGWRPHIESLRCLNLTRMLQTGAVKPDCFTAGTWAWTDLDSGKQTAAIGYVSICGATDGTLRLQYSIPAAGGEKQSKDYTLRLSSVPLRYGGRRWYVHCPVTDRRVLRLYLVQGTFVARLAIRPKPTYALQRESGVWLVIRRRWAIREKLGDPGDLFGPLVIKPKWMRWKTWERYAAKDAALSDVESAFCVRRFGCRLE